MYGLVNQALEDFVRRGFGDAAWKQIRDNAGLNLEMFVSMDSYPDEVTYQLVGAATEVLNLDAARILEAAWDDAARIGDPFIESIAVNQFGWAHLVLGDPRPEAFARSLELAYGLNSEDGGAYGLEGLAAASAALGDFDRAGVMLGIADAMRARTGLSDQRSIVTYQQIIAQVLEGDHSDAFETGRARGRRMPRRAAIALALGQEPPA